MDTIESLRAANKVLTSRHRRVLNKNKKYRTLLKYIADHRLDKLPILKRNIYEKLKAIN